MLALHLEESRCSRFELEQETKIKIISIESNLLTEMSFYTGRHSKPILFHLDFNFNKVVIPSIIRETPNPESVLLFNFLDCFCKNCCKLVDQEDNLVMYKDRLLWLKKTKLYFSLNFYDYSENNKKRKLKVYLSEKGLPSTRNRALMGLGVESPLWLYFIQIMMEEKLDKLFITFNYKSALDSFDQITFTPEQGDESFYTSLKITSELTRSNNLNFLGPLPKNGLIFSGGIQSEEMNFNYDNINICIDNTALSFIIFKEKLNFMNYLKKLICHNPKFCTTKEHLNKQSGKLQIKITMPSLDNHKNVVLVVSTKELYTVDRTGKINWGFKEFNDFLDNKEFKSTPIFKDLITDGDISTSSSQEEDLDSDIYQKNMSYFRKKRSKVAQNDDDEMVPNNDDTNHSNPTPKPNKEHINLKYDYYESLEHLYKELNQKETVQSIENQNNQNCDVLLGTRFMFKYNLVFRILKKNAYPLQFEIEIAFNENKKFIQDWRMGFCYLGASLLIALIIIFFLRNNNQHQLNPKTKFPLPTQQKFKVN